MSERHVNGSVVVTGDTAVIRMEDVYRTDVDDLWRAVTVPDRLARWVAEVAGDLEVGGHFEARFTSGWEGVGRVEICDAPHHLLVTLQPGLADQTEIDVRLHAEGELTRLVVEERGLPAAEAAEHGAGWQAHVEDLGAYLDGQPAGDWKVRWAELTAAYRERRAATT